MDLGKPNDSGKDPAKTNQATPQDESVNFTNPAPATPSTPAPAEPAASAPPSAPTITPTPPVAVPPPPATTAPAANPADVSIPINTNTPTNPAASSTNKSDIGVGRPNIGVELEDPPASQAPVLTPTPVIPLEEKTPSPAPQEPALSAAPTPVQSSQDSIEVPINKYSSNVTTEDTPEPTTAANEPVAAPTIPSAPKPPIKAARATALITFLALFALIAGSAGGFFGFKYLDKVKSSADELGVASTSTVDASASPEVTNKTKEYTSTKYGFSLQYPSNWYASTADTQASSIIFASNQESLEGTPTGYKASVDFQDNDGKTLKAWVDAYKVSSGETAEPTQITVSNTPAYQQKLAKNGAAIATYVPLTDKIMVITYTAPTDKFSAGEDFYNKIIESIKVTE